MKENPDAVATDIAKEFGCSTALIYNAKSGLKKKPRRKKVWVSRNGAPAEPLVLAAQLIKACGRIEEAERALQMAGAVAKTLK